MLRQIGDIFHAIGNRLGSSGESQIRVNVAAYNQLPVNEPGSNRPMSTGQWYRAVNERDESIGFVWYCRCGQSNIHFCGFGDLRRELEKKDTHRCTARCVSVEWKRDEQGQPMGVPERIVHVVADKEGNEITTGAPYTLLSCLPDEGKNMSEAERNKFYALLPAWRIGRTSAQCGPLLAFDNECETEWAGQKPVVPAGWQ